MLKHKSYAFFTYSVAGKWQNVTPTPVENSQNVIKYDFFRHVNLYKMVHVVFISYYLLILSRLSHTNIIFHYLH